MVIKSFACPNGHQWRDATECARCPVCGAEAAETIGNGHPQHESTENGSTRPSRATKEESSLSRFGRYKVIEELGHGGMGVVYRAFDPVHDRQVALKTLPSTDPALLSRFKREFRLLADVDHPNVVKLFELTSDGDTWFFTMEIIEGVDLLTYFKYGFVQPSIETQHVDRDVPALTEQFNPFAATEENRQRLRSGLAQLSGAVATLHASGVVHRDIKPSNVIVTRDGRVVLLDFGLVAETDPSGIHQSLHQNVMGTAAYMSPEQAACDPVSSASDWYSVGVMLYQALTGRLPYSGNAVDVLFNKQRHRPVPPGEIEPSVSRDWNDLCMVLLCRNPENRPPAEDILQRLGHRTDRTALRKVVQPNESALVGRESQLQTIHEAWRAVQSGKAKLAFVEGRSGTGKSALVEAFIEQATGDGAVILKGRCYEMESVPFKAIDSLVDSLVDHLKHLPQAEAAALMPRDIHSLSRLFPVIGQIEAVTKMPRRQIDIPDQQELNRRAIGALRELLARMGDRYPLVVYIDDLQWGDEDSAAMLSNLVQPPDPPVLLFLGTYRSEDADTSQFIEAFRRIQRQQEMSLESLQIEVTPLKDSDAVKLALVLLKRDDPDAQRSAELIAQETGGNPFFVSELVKHLQLDGIRVSNATEPLDLVDMIWARVQRLPEESQSLLAVVALSGRPMPLEQAMRIADVGQSAIGPLRTGHFIRTGGLASSSNIETYHDRVRESVSACLDHAQQQRHHLRIAEDYARISPLSADAILERLLKYFADGSAQLDDPLEVVAACYDAAFHFDTAGRPDLAFSYAFATAEKSRLQFSLEVAEQQYRIAERGLVGHGSAVRNRVAEGLGDVLMLRGNYPAAAREFETARNLVNETDDQARIEGKIGELAFKCGDNKTAAKALEQSLRLLGRRIPPHASVFVLFLAWEAVVQALHTLLPKMFQARLELQRADKEFLAIRLYTRLAYAYFFDRGKVPCLWSHLRAINLAERYPPTLELGHALATHAPVMSLIPWIGRGEAFAEKSLRIRRDLRDIWGQGQSLHYWGIVLFIGVRFDECIRKCREAISLLQRTGDYWEVNIARYAIANSIYRKGDLSQAITEAKRLHEAAHEMGDDKASGFSLEVWSRASGGRLPADVVRREMQKERNDVQATAQVMLAEGVRLVGQRDLTEAVQVLNHAREVCHGVGMMNGWVSPLLPWLATALRLQSQDSAAESQLRQREMLRSARRVALQALSVARKFQTDLPHALREAGLISAMQGSDRLARKYLDESLEVAERQGAKFEHAQTALARGNVGLTLGWPDAAEEVETAEQVLRGLGADFALAYFAAPV